MCQLSRLGCLPERSMTRCAPMQRIRGSARFLSLFAIRPRYPTRASTGSVSSRPVSVCPPNDEGRRLLRIVRRGTGSVVTWRRAQMVLLSAQSMAVVKIAEVTFTSPDRVRDLIHDFNTDGFDSLYPKYKGGRPKSFTLPERREVKKISKSKPVEHGLPFSTWSLVKLADFLVAEDVVDDISHEGLRVLLREEGLSIQRSTCEDLEDLDRPELCGEEVQGRAPLRHRRW